MAIFFGATFSGDIGQRPWPGENCRLGSGYDTIRDEICANAVTGTSKVQKPEEADLGQRVRYACQIIEDEYEFSESLRVTASASMNKFGGGGSARLEMSRSVKFNSYNVNVLAMVNVFDHTELLEDYSFNDKARYEWENTKANRNELFIGFFGDTFIDSISWGGELFVLFELLSTSREERQSIKAELSASMGAWSGSGGLEKATTEIRKHKQSRLIMKYDGSLATPPSNDMGEVLTFIRAFPGEIHKAPVAFSVTNQRYGRVPGKGMDLNLESINAHRQLDSIYQFYSKIRKIQSSFEFAEKISEIFKGVTKSDIVSGIEVTKNIINKCTNLVDEIPGRRFDPKLSFDEDDLGPIPSAPQIAKGQSIDITVTIYGISDGDGSEVKQVGTGGSWVGTEVTIQGFAIDCKDLPEGTQFEYQAHRTKLRISVQ